ncbi:hypothetical protein LTR36_010347 [Oleoguttula mirabilis]|uniref:Pet127-domain-containing protein n=1 Tax=Oleoguttula mirabilis TaxID=1507867 RepID=A0AAV9J572_9PEZI|nr:hypothetical protein LTR36_010347 [Oleoguttula mirabilis]
MQRSLVRQPTWTAGGYVCRRCQHHLAAAQQQQGRHASTSTSAAVGGDDMDWFNSLSDDYGDRKRPTSKKEGEDDSGPAAHEEKTPRSKPKRQGRRERERQKRGVAEAGGHDFEEMKSSLAMRVARPKAAAAVGAAKSETAFKRPKAPPASAHDKAKMKAFFAMRKDEAAEKRRQRQALAQEATQADGAGGGDEGTRTNRSGDRQEFEDIMARLQREVQPDRSDTSLAPEQAKAAMQKTEVEDDVNVPAGLISDEQSSPTMLAPEEPATRMATPHFSYIPARDAITVPAGLVSNKPKQAFHYVRTSRPEASDSEQPEDTLLGASQSEPAPMTFSFGKARKPLSLAARVQEAKDRPKWGGFSSSAHQAQSKVSFDSLRATDKVSKERVVTTAGERKAWGLEASAGAKPGSSEEIASKESADAQAERTQSTVGRITSAFSSLSSSRFDQLKQSLGFRVGKDDGPADQAVDVHAQPGDEHLAQAEENQVHALANDVGAGDQGFDFTIQRHTRAAAQERHFKKAVVSMPPERREIDDEVREQEDEGVQLDDAMDRLAKLHTGNGAMPDASAASAAPVPADASNAGLLKGAEGQDGATRQAHARPLSFGRIERKARRAVLKKQLARAVEIMSSEAEPEEVEHRSLSEVMRSSDAASHSKSKTGPSPETESTEVAGPEVLPSDIRSISASELRITPLNVEQPPVPPLQYGLDRVLFNPGVYQLQDPHSRVYNFDPYLQKIMPVSDFDFNALKEYKTSSQDTALSDLAKQHGKKYVGSTSSMTGTLGHFHYLLSNWRDLNLNMLSRAFPDMSAKFTMINKAPNAIFLRWRNGTYAIDADKEYDSANVLMMLGKSMEKLLTVPREEFERYRKGSANAITPDEKGEPESYEYTTMGDFLMRSQLDAHDRRLPGTGMFDLKTRAVVSIRMDAASYQSMLGYELHTLQGNFESYEREYYDMLRSTMLKYMLQARMGRMDGIFVAYHNVQRIFGFQYVSIADMDRAIHGQVDPCLGDQEFRTSLQLMNEVMEMATQQFPETSLRMHFEATEVPTTLMWVFAEPMTEPEIEGIQSTSKAKVEEFEREVMGMEKEDGMKESEQAAAEASVPSSAMVDQTVDSESSSIAEPSKEAAPASRLSTPASADHTSTTTPADPVFISHIETEPAENLKPLFAATIICQNFVNGVPVDHNHVVNLKRHDKWEVQYILKEAQMSPAEKWARYQDVKTRRRKNFQRVQNEDGEDGPAVVKQESHYIKVLREMSARGKEFRKKIDELEATSEKIVFDAPLSKEDVVVEAREDSVPVPEESLGMGDGEKVGNVDDYMRWLYRGQDSA